MSAKSLSPATNNSYLVNIFYFRRCEKIMIVNSSLDEVSWTSPEKPLILKTIHADEHWIEDAEDWWRHAHSHGKYFHATADMLAWAQGPDPKQFNKKVNLVTDLVPLSVLAKHVSKNYRTLLRYATIGAKKGKKKVKLQCSNISGSLHSSRTLFDNFIEELSSN